MDVYPLLLLLWLLSLDVLVPLMCLEFARQQGRVEGWDRTRVSVVC